MPEADNLEGKQFRPEIAARNSAFHVKGAGAYDWGMQSRLNRVFSPTSGRTVPAEASDWSAFHPPDSIVRSGNVGGWRGGVGAATTPIQLVSRAFRAHTFGTGRATPGAGLAVGITRCHERRGTTGGP